MEGQLEKSAKGSRIIKGRPHFNQDFMSKTEVRSNTGVFRSNCCKRLKH